MTLGENLLRFNKEQKYCFFDKETEGLNLVRSRPWQVAWLIATLDKIEQENDQYPWFEDLKVSPAAARITRFDWNDYRFKAKDPREVLEEFEKTFLDENIIKIGHNIIGYDIYIYNVWRRALGLPVNYDFLRKSNFIDTNVLAKAYKKGIKVPPLGSKEYFEFNFKMAGFHAKGVKTNLTALGKEFKIVVDYDNLHDGINDIRLNHLVFQKLVWLVEI
jgi:hypothetical protein